MLAIIVGAIAFCAQRLLSGQSEAEKIQIGIVVEGADGRTGAGERPQILTMALDFLASMDSVQASCEFIYMDEATAMTALDNQRLTAVMLVPETLVGDIIDGTNTPVKVLFAREDSLTAALLQALTDAGARLLGSAQAGIYAVTDLYFQYDLQDHMQQAYDALNASYLNVALNRSRVFEHEQVSVTGELSAGVFYAAGGFVLFLLLSGMGLAGILRQERRVLLQKLIILGISPAKYTIVRFTALWLCYSILSVSGLLLFFGVGPVNLLPGKPESQMLAGAGTAASPLLLMLTGILLAAVSVSMFLMIYQCMKNAAQGMLLTFSLMVVGMVISGGIIPAGFLPEQMTLAGKILPMGLMLDVLRTVLGGAFWQDKIFWLQISGLILYTVVFVSAAVILCRRTLSAERLSAKEDAMAESTGTARMVADKICGSFAAAKNKSRTLLPGVWLQMSFKRLLCRSSFIAVLVAFGVMMTALGLSQKSEPLSLKVGLYMEDDRNPFLSEIADSVRNAGGVFDFYLCDSKAQLQKDVAAGRAECGYVLPDNLKEDLMQGEVRHLITAYTSPATLMSELIDEVIFSYIFRAYAPWVYSDYVAAQPQVPWDGSDLDFQNGQRQAQKERMNDGSTFSFTYNHTPGVPGMHTSIFDSYDESLFGTFIFMCALLGGYLSLKDRRDGVYIRLMPWYRRVMPACNILATALCAAVVVLICHCLTTGFGGFGSYVLYMCAYILFVCSFVWILYQLLRSEMAYGMAVLLLSLGSLLSIFIQAGLDSLLSWLKYLGWLCPPFWFVDQNRMVLWMMVLIPLALCGFLAVKGIAYCRRS